MKNTTYCFILGFLYHGAFDMFNQDRMGLEHYIIHVQNNWIDLHWGIGFSLMCLFICLAYIITKNDNE